MKSFVLVFVCFLITTNIWAQPVNDQCVDALILSHNSTCIYTAATSDGATDNDEIGDCTQGVEKAVWFKFTAAETSAIVNVVGSLNYNTVLGAITTCGGSIIPSGGVCVDITGDNGLETINLTGLSVGQTYNIQVYDFAGNANVASTFDIGIGAIPPPCIGIGLGTVIIPRLPYDSGAGQTTCGNGDNITSANVTVCGSPDYYTGQDKTYIFTPTISGVHTIQLTTNVDYNAGLVLYDGCPMLGSGGTCVAQSQNTTGLTRVLSPNLTAGVTYFLVADNWISPDCMASYRLQIETPLPCPTPTAVTSSDISSNSAFITWSCPGCTGTYIIEYGYPGYTPGTGLIAGFGGTMVTSLTDSIVLTSLDHGSVYNLYVRQNCGLNGMSANSEVHIFETLRQTSNDNCATASVVNPTGLNLSEEDGSANTGGALSSCADDINDGVWYTFIGTGNEVTIIQSSTWNAEIAVYEACPTLICIAGADGGLNSETVTFLSTSGTTYYVNVGSWLGTDSTNGEFLLSIILVPLPITISNISAQNMGKNNLVSWTTASEVNNNVQMVERSHNGLGAWDMVGKVSGTNSRESVTYEIADRNPFNSSYYRVHAIDFDGKEQYSKIVSVQRTGSIGIINNIQPNPTANFVEINLQPEFDGNITYTVMDATGKILKTDAFSATADASNTHLLDMSDLQTGLYFVAIKGGGINQNEKIYKQ